MWSSGVVEGEELGCEDGEGGEGGEGSILYDGASRRPISVDRNSSTPRL